MITVACVLVDGPVKSYDVDHVVRLERMVRRYLDRPFVFSCVTDGTRGDLPPSITAIHIPSAAPEVPANGRGYWAKLHLFNRALGWTGRVLFLDLDVLVVGDLTPIVDYPAALALTADATADIRPIVDQDRYGRRVIRKFNSSVMVWDAGLHDHLFDRATGADLARLSTDQDWIAEQAPAAVGMPTAWFPRISRAQPPWDPDVKVVLVKKPKPADARAQWPWFDAWWGGWAA